MMKTIEPLNPAARSLQRLRPRLEAHYTWFAAEHPEVWDIFMRRLDANFERLFDLLLHLYRGQYDFFYHLEELLAILARTWIERSPELKQLDAAREAEPHWFLSNRMLGGVIYVDLFAGDLNGIRSKIPYFKELGLTYLHLMPLFRSPAGENDGGYAVSSYREVNPALGSMEQLCSLASELRREGISLVLDFVFNHTSDEHTWAMQALAGDTERQEYYRMFPDRVMPDAYETHLREIFPDDRRAIERSAAFTYRAEIGRWVWTTFHSYQWDLNYANPALFNCMVEELLFLANMGVEVLRLDAVAFIWKRLGTTCENLPEAHKLIQAFNASARIAAPALLFKSEAIVHPDEVARYIHREECQISYHPLLMALLWESLATREVRLLQHSMQRRFKIPSGCAWVNYVRSHDDIGWTFSDEDAARLGINGYGHRQFLNSFYTGQFEGSFARGLPFQYNPQNGDMRISGTCASLAGLEKALQEETEAEVELAIRRILLIHSVILSIGGIPLIYLGDEVGRTNDYGYRRDPAKAGDSRWVHRPSTDWEKNSRRTTAGTLENSVFTRLCRLIQVRKNNPAFAGEEAEILDLGNPHILAYTHDHEGERVLVLANFIEEEQSLPFNLLRLHGLSYRFTNLVTGEPVAPGQDLSLGPYQFMWLATR